MTVDHQQHDVVASESSQRDRLSSAAITGARSYALSRIVIEASNLAAIIIVARLISPSATGHAAVALVFPAIGVILTFEGFGAPLVQRKDASRDHLRTAMTLSVATGAAASAVVALGMLAIGADVFGAKTASLVLLVSPVFVLSSFGTVSRALLMRDLRFKLMSRRDSSVIFLQNVLTVLLAVAGLRASAFIYPALAAATIDAAVMVLSARPAGFGWSATARHDIWAYGAFASCSGLVSVLRGNIDYIILAATTSARQTGIYYRSFQFGAEYQSKVTRVVVLMLFPLLARADYHADLLVVRERSMRINAILALPLLGLVVVLAPELVPLLYGQHWTAAILPTQILAFAGMMSTLLVGAEVVPMALGRTGLLLGVSVLFLIVYGTGIAVAVPFGLTAICCMVVGIYTVMLFVVNYLLVDRLLNLRPGALLADCAPAVIATAISGLLAEGCRLLLRTELPPIGVVCVTAVVSLTAFVAVLRFGFPETWRWMSRIARRTISES